MRARVAGLSRGVVVGIVAVVLVGVGVLWVLRPSEPGPGRLVFVDGEEVVARDLASGEQQSLAELPRDAREVSISPDGRSLSYIVGSTVFLLDLETGEPRRLAEEGLNGGWALDGLPIVFVPAGEGVSTLAIRDGDNEQVLLGPGPWSLEGDVVWLERGRFAVRLIDLEANRAGMVVVSSSGEVPELLHTVPDATPLAGAADGAELLYAAGQPPDLRLSVLSVRTFESRTFEFTGTFNDVAVSEDGIPAMAAVDPDGNAGIWLLDREAQRFELVIEEGERVEWSADGSALIYSVDGAVWLRTLSLRRPDRIGELITKSFTVVG